MSDLGWSPAALLNSAHIERWLRSIWPSWRVSDVRWEWDPDGRWLWIVPDYATGRSRVLGIARRDLERMTLSRLRDLLEKAEWMERIKREALFIDCHDDGSCEVTSFEPEIDEAWFEDPAGGYFVALRGAPAHVSASKMPPTGVEFLALQGKRWSCVGPKGTKDPKSYSQRELLKYLPHSASSESI